MINYLKSPWTNEQVDNLERRQVETHLHPYTCECGHSLIPTIKGWECDECAYTQDWCMISDAEGIWPEKFIWPERSSDAPEMMQCDVCGFYEKIAHDCEGNIQWQRECDEALTTMRQSKAENSAYKALTQTGGEG